MPDPAPAGLVYVSDRLPGITRHRRGGGFAYRRPDGRWLRTSHPDDREDLARIRRLAIPPAYVQVWICTLPNGHLQATGRDARGRKQYRYHPDWQLASGSWKFDRMTAFGEVLPALRRRVQRDLAAAPAVSRPAVLAALVRLLDATRIRVGNEAYVRSNGSYGLTTLRNRHVAVQGSRIRLRFRGKSGVLHERDLDDPAVARIVRRCQALPGQELFQYEDADGTVHHLDSADVNDYIRSVAGGDFTAKDFRTWHATVHAWSLLAPGGAHHVPSEAPASSSASPASSASSRTSPRLRAALAEVASGLGNTVAVCRKSYVHPQVLVCAEQGRWPEASAPSAAPRRGLSAAERGLLAFLEAVRPPAAVSPAATSKRVRPQRAR